MNHQPVPNATAKRIAIFSVAIISVATARASEPAADPDQLAATPISSDEKFADAFSLEKGYAYLGYRAVNWGQTHGCVTCHTNGLFLISGRPDSDVLQGVQEFAREYLQTLASEGTAAKRLNVTGLVAVTALLAISENRSETGLHPITRQAFDLVWTLQNEEGCWDWLKCNWPPYEVDDHFGSTLVAIALGTVPDEYRQTPAARQGVEKLRRYFARNPPATMHQRAMLLWASSSLGELLSAAQQRQVIDDLFALQQEDGGWNVIALGPPMSNASERKTWVRSDGLPQDDASSDGYATGFAVYVLRQAGIPADDWRIERGIAWLKGHQRISGRWFTRSPRVDNEHFISHAGTSFALLALEACRQATP